MRLFAASNAGPSALEAYALDVGNPPKLRCDALEQLEVRVSRERLSPLLGKLLDLPGEEPLLRALSLVASRHEVAHEPKVCVLAGLLTSRALAEAVPQALLALGSRSEPAMIALVRSPWRSARIAGIHELMAWGTVASVEALLALDGQGAVGELAQVAARTIQGRLSGAQAGGVSLVQEVDSGGAVSLAPLRDKA
ncbi:MAG: hypothetical protein QM765_31955 [Myxococcales bacterium]